MYDYFYNTHHFYNLIGVFTAHCQKKDSLFRDLSCTRNLRANTPGKMQLPELTDMELVEKLKAGDAHAFRMIYYRYWRRIYGFVYQQLGSKEEAEEVIHDLMLRLWDNREQAEIQSLRVYLFIAARNLVNRQIRSQVNLRKYREYQLMHELFEHVDTDEIFNENQFTEALERVLSRLPEKTAMVFRKSKIEELPVKRIAIEMGLTDKAVEYHITKSMRIVREQLRGFHSDN